MAAGIRVLHVDDDPSFADVTATVLEREDDRLRVETATSADEGLERLAAGEFDCVVSDYDMPGRDGIEFLEAVREDYPALPFVLFTGKGSEEVASDAISAGVSDYLQKEPGSEQYSLLANRIDNLVSQYHAEARLETRAEQQHAVAELGKAALAGESCDALFEQAVTAVADALDDEYAEVLEHRPERGDLLLRAGVGWRDGLVGEATVGDGADSQAGHTLRSEGPIVVEDLRTEDRFDGPELLVEHDVVSGVSVVIGSPVNPWGVLGTHTTEPTTFTDDDVNFVRNVANVLAHAIEREERERELRRKERRYKAIFDDPNILVGLIDTDGTVLDINRTAMDYVDAALEDVRGEPFWETPWFDHSETVRAEVRDWIDRAATGEYVEFEAELVRPDGRPYTVEGVFRPVTDGDGEVVSLLISDRDVSERKARERAMEALNDVAVDLEGYETAERICERTIEASKEVLEFDLSVIDLEEEGYLRKAAISEDIEEANTATMSVEEGLAGKSYRTGESLLVDDVQAHPDARPQGPFRSAISIPIGTHGVFQAVDEEPGAFDETDLELAELLISHTASALDRLEREQQLAHQNERLEEFTRIVSHDLRNPVNVLGGYLELAREDCESEHLADAAEALARMESILEGTLTLAREGRIVDEMEPVRLDELAGACWDSVTTGAAALEVATGATIQADADRLRHVFENLFRNAVEHGGPDVTVRVGDFEGGFYVEDDGPGVPPTRREALFEPGHASDGSSGFGLAIVRQVAEAHGWEVDVTDGTEGGARFEFSGVDRDAR